MGDRGEFTRRFDRDILGDETAAEEERRARERQVEAEDQALEAEFQKILSVLDYRANWLHDRFPSCSEASGLSFRGRRFEFADSSGQTIGWIEFHARLTDSLQGIALESFMELEEVPRRHDYVNFPKENVSLDRVKRFVESKLLEFAGPFQDALGG